MSLQTQLRLRDLIANATCNLTKVMLQDFLSKVEGHFTSQVTSENAGKVKDYIKTFDIDGKFSSIGFWKLKRKLCNKECEPPMAKEILSLTLNS